MKTYKIIDIETTHLNPNQGEIIEICIITMKNGIVTEEFATKIKPLHLHRADPRALKINRFTREKWKDAPTLLSVADDIAKRCKYGVLVGHNIGFDVGYLRKHLPNTKISYQLLDTITLAREHLPINSVSLDNCRAFFGLSCAGNHSAVVDAYDTLAIFRKLYRASRLKRLYWRIKNKI